MTLKNMVGLEAEFLLGNKFGEIIFPSEFGFSTDEYILLAEIRADPGNTREETISNFVKVLTKFERDCWNKELSIVTCGWTRLLPDFNAKVLRMMGSKEISKSENIYGTDLLSLTDDVIEDGKFIGRKVSAGLHVHFSSEEKVEVSTMIDGNYEYIPTSIPLQFADSIPLKLDLYRRMEVSDTNKKKPLIARASANRITKPVLRHIVKEMDVLLDGFLWGDEETKKLKYRQPGFYEMKFHGGFEYRSLPANEKTISLHGITKVVNKAFDLLDDLNL